MPSRPVAPHPEPHPQRADLVQVPSREDAVARSASEVVGGPLGRYAVRLPRGWRSYAALLAGGSAVTSGLAVVLRAPCIDSGWSSPDQFWHACFSDLPAIYRDADLSAGLGTYLQGGFGAPAPTQPPLTSFLMTLTASVVPGGPIEERMQFYFALWTVVAAVLLALVTWWTAASVRRFPLRAALVAISPVAVLTLVISPDVVGVALASAAMYAWSRERSVAAGVLLGLATSARSYPVLILLAMLLLSVRTGRVHVWVRTAGAATLVFGGILFVLGALNADAASSAYRSWFSAGAGFGSPWVLPQLAGHPLSAGTVSILAAAGWLLAVLVGAGFALSTPRRPGLAEVSLVMVAIVLLTGKSLTVQSSLWLVPLVALIGLAWKDVVVWSAVEALHFEAVWLYLAGTSVPSRGLPASWYSAFVVLRLGGILWLAARTWQLARSRPPVRDEEGAVVDSPWADEESDDLAGPLRGAPDQLVVRFG
ncbi:MAG: hypothetical protein ABIW80_14040 [Lapillicoccus sp.]